MTDVFSAIRQEFALRSSGIFETGSIVFSGICDPQDAWRYNPYRSVDVSNTSSEKKIEAARHNQPVIAPCSIRLTA